MTLFFGWDVSTVVLGMCCLRDDGSCVDVKHVILDSQKDIRVRMGLMRDAIVGFVESCRSSDTGHDEYHFVENRLKNMAGLTNKDTLLALASMNGVATHVIMDMLGGDGQRLYHPYPATTIKWSGLSIPKGTPSDERKAFHVDFAAKNCDRFVYETNQTGTGYRRGLDDAADAYIVSRAGLEMWRAGRLEDALPRKKGKSVKKGTRKTGA